MTRGYKLPKLALELIGYMLTSFIIANFSFAFLYFTSLALIEKSSLSGITYSESMPNNQFLYWLKLACFIATLIVFFTFFLLFFGQKIAYILSITKAVQVLKEGNLDFRIECVGDDEISELADTINSFAQALQNHIQNENTLKKEKEMLIRSLSHDIRTPLTAIISYSDFIKNNKYDSEEKLEYYIRTIQSKAYQIQELTNLLLNSDTNPSENSEHPLLEGKVMFRQFLSEFADALEDEHFEVELNLLGLIDFKTHFDVQDISRIFDNLYSNIIKYADPKEKISLKIFLTTDSLVLIQSNAIKDQKNNVVESYGIGLKSIQQILSKYQGEMYSKITHQTYTIEIKFKL